MGCGPGWLRSLPAETLEISHTSGVEDNTFLFEQVLLVLARTDFALGVDHALPGDRWIGWSWRKAARASPTCWAVIDGPTTSATCP